jgi:hypothetical protein
VGLSSPELRRAQSLHLRRTIARRRTACDFTPSSGQHSLTGAEQITGTPPPLRWALTGGKGATTSSPAGSSSPELRRAQSLHLRRTIARRRTACDFTPSSGQHSLTGAEQITGTPPPLRRALTGGKLATTSSPAGSSSPELRRAQSLHLRRTIARRRTACDFTPSSGQHSLTGAEQITGTPPPLRRALTGGKLRASSIPDAGSIFLI